MLSESEANFVSDSIELDSIIIGLVFSFVLKKFLELSFISLVLIIESDCFRVLNEESDIISELYFSVFLFISIDKINIL